MKRSFTKYRSFLVRGTIAIAITSILAIRAIGCVHTRSQRIDTEPQAPTNAIEEVTTICSTTQTIPSSTTLASTKVRTTTTSILTTTTVPAETTLKITTEIPATNSETTPTNPITEEVILQTELPITNQEFVLIANVVSHEAGSSWISEYERACIVAAIMDRVYDSRFPNTVDEVVHQPGQMFDVPYYRVDYSGIGYEPIDNAIYAYFNGKYDFGKINSWTGDGYHNYFYYQ